MIRWRKQLKPKKPPKIPERGSDEKLRHQKSRINKLEKDLAILKDRVLDLEKRIPAKEKEVETQEEILKKLHPKYRKD